MIFFLFDKIKRLFVGPGAAVIEPTRVRQAVQVVIEAAQAEIGRASDDLIAGRINQTEWALLCRESFKRVHVAAGIVGAGGRDQLTGALTSELGRRLKEQYRYFEDFAYQVANGTQRLDGTLRSRAQLYASAAYGTMAGIDRKAALSRVKRERRLLTPGAEHCRSCVKHEAKGWQMPGVLPDIGDDCECKSQCRCLFERELN